MTDTKGLSEEKVEMIRMGLSNDGLSPGGITSLNVLCDSYTALAERLKQVQWENGQREQIVNALEAKLKVCEAERDTLKADLAQLPKAERECDILRVENARLRW